MHYHVTRSKDRIEHFRPFTHFGVAQAALKRSRSAAFERAGFGTGHVYEVDLDIEPGFLLRVPDLTSPTRQSTHSLTTLADMLYYDLGAISSANRDAAFAAAGADGQWNEAAGMAALAHVIGALGYQGLVYANAFEAKGRDSIMILRPEQVRVVQVISLDELAQIAERLSGAGVDPTSRLPRPR